MSTQPSLPSDFVKTASDLIREVKALRQALNSAELERDVAIDNLGRQVLENLDLKKRIARLKGEIQ